MSRKSSPTNEWAQSRHLSSPIIGDARERLAVQHKIIPYKEYSWYWKKEFDHERFDYAHMDNLIEHEYVRLRGLYSIPFVFEEFQSHVYYHPKLYPWARNGYFAAIYNSRIYGSKRRKRHMWDRWGDRTGVYYRVGPAKMSANPQKKAEPVSDHYQVNPEVARKDWREKKGFRKDHRKGRQFCKCSLNDSRAGRRAWERDMIRKGRWEEMTNNKNLFTDGWQCC